MSKKILIGFFIYISAFFVSCRGERFKDPPILPIQNMVEQTSFGPQSKNNFYADDRSARPPVKNTVSQDVQNENIPLSTGRTNESTTENPVWITDFPVKLSPNFIQNGRAKYNVYCAPCHGLSGHNDGLVTDRAAGAIRPALIHDERVVQLPVGKIYDAVTNGVNNWNMPGFVEHMSVIDRWAVVAYVRALQLSERAQDNQN